jgi:hypothetical protein
MIEATTSFAKLDGMTQSEFFKNNCMKLNDVRAKEIIDFYNDARYERYGHAGILQAEYSYEYNKILHEWQRKICVIEYDDDLIIVFVKFVNMWQNRYCRIDGTPISVGGNIKNENIVMQKLYHICEKIVGFDVEEIQLQVHKRHNNWNFYSNIENNYGKMNNRWRTKKGINKLLGDKMLTWKVADKSDQPMVELLCKSFQLWKKEVEGSKFLSKHLTNGIMKYEYWDDDSVRYYIFEYAGQPLGLIVYVLVNGKIAYQIANKGIKHMIIQDEIIIPTHIEKRLGAYMHYITVGDLQKLKLKHMYCGSALGDRKSTLKIFKSIMNDTPVACNIYHSGLRK